MGLCPIAAEEKPVVEVLTDVAFRQLVQEQVAAAMSRCCAAVRTGTMKRSQMQTLNWSPDRRPYLSYRFLLCRDGQPDALSGRASNGELPG